jgi:DNA-binding transcriptional regulator PaaX
VKSVRKYKYYFKKPRTEVLKDCLRLLLTAGGIVVAANSPYFLSNVINKYERLKKYPKKKVSSTFSNLKKQGYIDFNIQGNQIYVSLTQEGKNRAGVFQIDELKLTRPKKWDRRWRIIIFDIPQDKKISREALRGKLKQLQFYMLQKSVWVYPFECRAELELLREFFGLSKKEIRLIVAESIEEEGGLRAKFKI